MAFKKNTDNKIFRHAIIFIIGVLFFGLVECRGVNAATLQINSSAAILSPGSIATLSVILNSEGLAINNAEAKIVFPADLLEVVSINKGDSVFSLWVEEPSYSNIAGTINFNGGIPTPGFNGSNGTAISIVVKAKKAGQVDLIFSDAAVRANDGLGTDVLSNKNGSYITIVSGLDTKETQKSSSLVITSSSHPNQNLWYNKNDIDLSWTLPKNATAVQTLLGAYADSDPIVYYGSPITNKSIQNVEDGTWYFHANYLADGVWSETGHYKLNIDTVDPTNLRVESKKDDEGKITLEMKAEDSLSGIDHFTVTANSDQPIVVKSDINGEASVEVPFSRVGEQKLTIFAFDKAGNKTKTEMTVTTDFAAELKIDSYPAKIRVNESIEASGTAPYPYTNFRVSLKNSDNVIEIYKIKSDSYSRFYFNSRPIPSEGEYVLWVEMLKENEEVNFSSQKVKIFVEKPFLLQIGSYTIGLMKVLIPAAILLMIFLFIILYGWYKFFNLYRKVKKESHEAGQWVGKSFDILHKDIDEHISKLKKAQSNRKLTSEEIDFLDKFEEELSEAENVIEKQVKDIFKS